MEFSQEDARRIARVVRQVERQSLNPSLERAQAGAYGAQTAFVRVTSLTTTSGRYPGKVLLFDSSVGTDTDLADCWVVDENGGTLAVSKYIGQRVGDANGEPVFRVCGPGTGGAGVSLPIASASVTFSGVRVRHSTNQTVANNAVVLWDTEDFDTDSYHSTSSNTSRLTAPSTGYYMVGVNLYVNLPSAVETELLIHLRLNATSFIGNMNKESDVGQKLGNVVAQGIAIVTLTQLTAGDYVEVVMSGSTTGNTTVIATAHGTGSDPVFWMARLGA